MKKYRKFLFLLVIPVFIVVILFVNNNKNESEIESILKTKSYSYLSTEAKEYIKEVYEDTGTVIKTEKNKVEDEPYLNPDYITYLENGSSEYGYIPDVYSYDHSYTNDVDSIVKGSNNQTSLSYYNLRDEGYITNIYDQGSEGLCWAFASTTSLESNLAIKSNKTKMYTFSEKQVDYATTLAKYAIDTGTNPYLNNDSSIGNYLGDGGNMLRYINSAAIGLSPLKCDGNCSSGTNYNSSKTITDNKYWKYDYDDTSLLSQYEVINTENVEYSLDEYLFISSLKSNDEDDIEALVNVIKYQIVNSGSIYTGIGAYTNLSIAYTPTGSETANNADGKNYIYYIPYGWDSNTNISINHAVSIIGWDDNYTHNICLNYNSFEITDATKSGNNYVCSSGTLYTINGAWILQNSWGNQMTYLYLPYTSIKSSFSSINTVSEVDYDNSYRAKALTNYFTKGNTKEKLNKVKFYIAGYNETVNVLYKESTHTIYLQDSTNTTSISGATLLKTVTNILPGLYTADLSSSNIIIDENVSEIKLEILGSKLSDNNYVSLHTNNVNNDVSIDLTDITKTEEDILSKCNLTDNDCISEPHQISFDDNNAFIISGITRGLSTDNDLTFKIYNSNNVDITSSFHIFRNYSVSNYINAIISYNSDDIEYGTYKIEVYYNSIKYDELSWSLTSHNTLQGIGSEYNPYLIDSYSDLNSIRNNTSSDGYIYGYYKLTADIDLTSKTKSGEGFEPINNFAGSLDGNNHAIIGLNINRSSTSEVGLFGNVSGWDNNYIKNLIIKNSKVIGKSAVGILIGSLEDCGIQIHDIAIINSRVYATSGSSGALIGFIGAEYDGTYDIYNIFSNATVGLSSVNNNGALIGKMDKHGKLSTQEYNMNIKDVVSIGKVYGNINTGGVAATLYDSNTATIKNIISAGTYVGTDTTSVGDLFGNITLSTTLSISNIYYLSSMYGSASNITGTSNISSTNIITFKSILTNNAISTFDNSSAWIYTTKDSIGRIPLLKIAVNYFDFTETIDDIVIGTNETINVYDLISPNNDYAKNIKVTYDNDYFTVSSYTFTPIKAGTTQLHIFSMYDGYEDDINVTIKEAKTVTYNSNNSSNETSTKTVYVNESFSLDENTYTYKGYLFKNWNTKKDGTGTTYTDKQLISEGISSDLTLYAIWDAITYTINFNGNGSNNGTDKITLNYPQTGKISFNNKNYTKEDYILDNWNTKIDGTGTKYLLDTDINFDDITFDNNYETTLYAIWKEEEYTITFNSNGATGSISDLTVPKVTGANLTKNTFTKTGYTFKNWNTKADGSGTSYSDEEHVSISSDITLYAIWDAITYKITYDSNGGFGSMDDSTLTYDVPYLLPMCLFNKTDKTFLGWNTKADGSGDYYVESAQVLNLTTENNATITLYAMWDGYILNETEDVELFYDGNYHSIEISVNVSDYTIKYSLDGINYDLDTNPSFNLAGEHIVYYKISKTGYNDLLGSNKVKIYGISNIDLTMNNDIIISNSNDFNTLKDKISIYATSYTITHLDSNGNETNESIKTADSIKIVINDDIEYFYTIAYLGDVNGNGQIDIIDYVRIMKDIMNINKLSGVYYEAADMNRNGSIDIIDYIRIMKIIMER